MVAFAAGSPGLKRRPRVCSSMDTEDMAQPAEQIVLEDVPRRSLLFVRKRRWEGGWKTHVTRKEWEEVRGKPELKEFPANMILSMCVHMICDSGV